jgi:hypothetical protein
MISTEQSNQQTVASFSTKERISPLGMISTEQSNQQTVPRNLGSCLEERTKKEAGLPATICTED